MKLKKSLSLLLVLMLVLSCISLPALAEELWADGATPPNNQIYYTATAKVTPYSDTLDDYPSSKFDSGTGKGIMTFTADITTLSSGIFRQNTNLTGIVLPASVTEIESYAFIKCTYLKTVSLPNATKIGSNAFSECENLTTISLPKATSIGASAFSECSSLTTISLPEATSILDNAFSKCSHLTKVYMPKAENIMVYDCTFDDCSALQYVYAPATDATTLSGYNLYSVSLSDGKNGTLTVADTDFEAVDGCQIYAKSGNTVQFTVTPKEGYKVDSLTGTYNDGSTDYPLTISNGSFTMPRYAVTLTATTSEIQTSGKDIDLDLEDSTTNIPASTTIDQYYVKTTGSTTVTNHRISIAWTTPIVHISVAKAQKWNYETLSWEVDTDKNGVATVEEGTNVTSFTLKNYSLSAFKCTMGFTPLDGCTSYFEDTVASFTNNDTQIGAIVTGADGNADAQYYVGEDTSNAVDDSKVPTLVITGTLNIDTSAFKNAAATTNTVTINGKTVICQQFGNYTITCTKVAQ